MEKALLGDLDKLKSKDPLPNSRSKLRSYLGEREPLDSEPKVAICWVMFPWDGWVGGIGVLLQKSAGFLGRDPCIIHLNIAL